MKEYRSPKCHCPICEMTLDSYTNTTGGQRSKPGDFSICIECENVVVFTKEMTLRRPNKEEKKELEKEPLRSTIRRTIELLRRVKSEG